MSSYLTVSGTELEELCLPGTATRPSLFVRYWARTTLVRQVLGSNHSVCQVLGSNHSVRYWTRTSVFPTGKTSLASATAWRAAQPPHVFPGRCPCPTVTANLPGSCTPSSLDETSPQWLSTFRSPLYYLMRPSTCSSSPLLLNRSVTNCCEHSCCIKSNCSTCM